MTGGFVMEASGTYRYIARPGRNIEPETDRPFHYEFHRCAEEKGKLASLVLAGLEFDLSEIQ